MTLLVIEMLFWFVFTKLVCCILNLEPNVLGLGCQLQKRCRKVTSVSSLP